jgi:hypothetical protein
MATEPKVVNETADRSQRVQKRLKSIYSKTVLPVEKRFRYDYFYESPFLTDSEFDCKCFLGPKSVEPQFQCLLFYLVLSTHFIMCS